MLCTRFQVQQHRWGFLASIFRTVRQGKILFHQERSCGDSKECVMWQLYPSATVLGRHPDDSQTLRAFYFRRILTNSSLGVFVKAGIRQSLARILAPPCHRPQRHLLLAFFSLHISQRLMHTHKTGTRMSCPTRSFTFFFSSLLGWNSDFQSSWESSKQKEKRKQGRNPNPSQQSL